MKLQLAVLASAFLASGATLAQAQAPEPDHTLSTNVGVVSDYRYRGISQSRLRPALQGGVDFAHRSGLYAGAWASTVRWIQDGGGNADVEVDLYGGYKTAFGGVGVDVGVLRYLYPNSRMSTNPDTTELYAAGSFGPATLKYSHAVTNLFGFANSQNSWYLDLSASFDTGYWGLVFVPHIGHQKVKNNASSSYTDWSLGLTKEFMPGLTGSLAYVGTDNDSYRGPGRQNLGKGGAVVGVKYTF